MNRIPAIPAALACILAICGCGPEKLAGGTGAGNPPLADVALSFKANSGSVTALPKTAITSGLTLRNPDGSFTIADSVGTPFLLTGIEIRVQRIEFDLPEGLNCAQVRDLPCAQNEASVKGPYSMDLMSGISAPAINFIKLPEGLYKTIGLGLAEPTADSGVAKDTTTNLIIQGESTGPKGKRKFELDLDLQDGLEFQDSAGIVISALAINRIVLSLNVDGWFAGTDLRKCLDQMQPDPLPDTSAVILIKGDSACRGAGGRIRKNIESSSDVESEEENREP